MILSLHECQAKDFFLTFQKLIKPMKLMMFVLNGRFISNSRIKATGYA